MQLSQTTIDRIESATKRSKIALFHEVAEGKYIIKPYFSELILIQRRIKSDCAMYIGSYSGVKGAKQAVKDCYRY